MQKEDALATVQPCKCAPSLHASKITSILGLPPKFQLNTTNNVCRDESRNHAAKDHQGLPNAGQERHIIGHDQVAAAELIHQVASLDD